MKKVVVLFIEINLLLFSQFIAPLNGQSAIGPDRNSITLPVEIPIFLAGNFGEPRPNHFHSGIDIKTNGATGIPVKAIADGYVSRIKVEPGGYGNALYIRHPDGFTTLYGHLLSFSADIRRFVITEQYRRESFAVDLFPDPEKLVINKGQIIALSGNSGSSEGPHLHFEVRETQSENPVNPLLRSIAVRDDIPPVIDRVYVYSLKEHRGRLKPASLKVSGLNGHYGIIGSSPVSLDGISGLGIEAFDILNGSDNHCGVYKIEGYLDDNLFFESDLDEISFSETRYVNSFMDYGSYMINHKTILKLFIDPNNQATIYRFAKNRGRISLTDDRIHKVRIAVSDAAGNQSTVNFDARLAAPGFHHEADTSLLYDAYFNYQETNSFQSDGIEISVPPGALYDDLYFDYTVSDPTPGSFSPLHQVHHPDVPLQLYYRLSIAASGLPQDLRDKATVVQCQGNNRYTSVGGTWEGDKLVTRTRSFGAFCIMVDTVKPEIKPLNFSSPGELKSLESIRFRVKDDFSGIQTCRGEIDGKWILMAYDLKSSTLEYQFDGQRIKTGIQHRMVIRATDQLGNSTGYSLSFFR